MEDKIKKEEVVNYIKFLLFLFDKVDKKEVKIWDLLDFLDKVLNIEVSWKGEASYLFFYKGNSIRFKVYKNDRIGFVINISNFYVITYIEKQEDNNYNLKIYFEIDDVGGFVRRGDLSLRIQKEPDENNVLVEDVEGSVEDPSEIVEVYLGRVNLNGVHYRF